MTHKNFWQWLKVIAIIWVAFDFLTPDVPGFFMALTEAKGATTNPGTGACPTSQWVNQVNSNIPGAACAQVTLSDVPAASKLSQPANPSAITPGTTTAQALGMGTGTGAATLTPTSSGRVYYTFSFSVLVGSITNGATFQCSHGTGTAPANAATTGLGTADSAAVSYLAGVATERVVVTCAGTLTGLVVGTAVWFDVIVLNTVGSQAVTVTVATFNAFEF